MGLESIVSNDMMDTEDEVPFHFMVVALPIVITSTIIGLLPNNTDQQVDYIQIQICKYF